MSGDAMQQHAIETVGLTKRFRRVASYRDLLAYAWRGAEHTAVDDVSLQIGRGELFGLLGQNGAGKTTLIRMLTTTLLPTSGRATVGSHDIVADPRGVRRIVGLVNGDERSFYLRLTGRENLEFFASLFHVAQPVGRRRMTALAERLGIEAELDRPYHAYSSGQRQKLSILRGMLTEPEILFMDEPTRALDPIAAHTVRRFISDHVVGELGRTVVLATHSTVEAQELCHRLALIREGRLAAVGTIAELRAAVGPRDRAQVKVRTIPGGLVEALSALPQVRSVAVEPNGSSQTIELHLADASSLNGVLAEVIARGAVVTGCTTQDVTLEEIYLAQHRVSPNVEER
jgi:ABC-2 type transport system ATP-binding protein